MSKSGKGCNVKSGSGYALDLNEDGTDEYVLRCHEYPHGPCGMVIFGKYKNTWKDLGSNLLDYGEYDPGVAPGFIILDQRDEGYHRICQQGENYKFKGGEYQYIQKP